MDSIGRRIELKRERVANHSLAVVDRVTDTVLTHVLVGVLLWPHVLVHHRDITRTGGNVS
jgi:hypothetical protein